jgi:hypothetical protein
MDPKFQSSFIPKGPVTSSGVANLSQKPTSRGLFSFLATIIFVLSLIAGVVVFGYNFYLTSNIAKMGNDLTTAKASLDPYTINQISRLNSRIISTQTLLSSHVVLSPLFDFLENSTLKSLRWTNFNYGMTKDGLQLMMQGQARGYSALALQADIFNKTKYIKSPLFTNLTLDDKGNVTFIFSAILDPSIVSYKKSIDSKPVVVPQTPASTNTPVLNRVSTSTNATSTKK